MLNFVIDLKGVTMKDINNTHNKRLRHIILYNIVCNRIFYDENKVNK